MTKVVIVGPSPCIEGLELGNLIDSYDIVCRVNQSYKCCYLNPDDYGKRTDVEFNTFNQFTISQLDITKFKNHTRFICTRRLCDTEIYNIPVHFEYISELDYHYNTGIIACYEILNHWGNISELFITGFSFHNEKQFYIDEIPTEPNYKLDLESPQKNTFQNDILGHPKANVHWTTVKALHTKRYKSIKTLKQCIEMYNKTYSIQLQEYISFKQIYSCSAISFHDNLYITYVEHNYSQTRNYKLCVKTDTNAESHSFIPMEYESRYLHTFIFDNQPYTLLYDKENNIVLVNLKTKKMSTFKTELSAYNVSWITIEIEHRLYLTNDYVIFYHVNTDTDKIQYYKTIYSITDELKIGTSFIKINNYYYSFTTKKGEFGMILLQMSEDFESVKSLKFTTYDSLYKDGILEAKSIYQECSDYLCIIFNWYENKWQNNCKCLFTKIHMDELMLMNENSDQVYKWCDKLCDKI